MRKYGKDRTTLMVERLEDRRTPSFGSPTLYGSANPETIATGDVDGDGDADMVSLGTAPGFTGHELRVRLNNGSGTFGSESVYTCPAGPRMVQLADLDNDDDLDAVVSCFGSFFLSDPRLVVFWNDASGGYSNRTSYVTDEYPFFVAVADLNADGFLDVAVDSSGEETVSIFFNNDGNGLKLPEAEDIYAYSTPVYEGMLGIGLADVDGDGDHDLLARTGDLEVFVRLNDGGGDFGSASHVTDLDGSFFTVRDLNGDGDPDLVTSSISGSALLACYGGSGSTFGAETSYSTGLANGLVYGITVADFDGDGDPDVAISDYIRGGFYLMNRTSTGFSAGGIVHASGESPTFLVAADLDADGDQDLLVIDTSGDGGIAVVLNT